jgi:hypothetical protein
VHEILDRSRGKHAAMRIQRINPKILRTADNLPLPQLLDHFSVATPAHLGEARNAADGLLALLGRAAEKQIAMPSSLTMWVTSSP